MTNLTDGYKVRTDEYTFSYDEANDGWFVSSRDRTKTEYEPIPDTFQDKPVINMFRTFAGCDNMITAPAIPKYVTGIVSAFSDCTSLTTAPVIPNGVVNIDYAFSDCINLKEIPLIPESVQTVKCAFSNCSIDFGNIDKYFDYESYGRHIADNFNEYIFGTSVGEYYCNNSNASYEEIGLANKDDLYLRNTETSKIFSNEFYRYFDLKQFAADQRTRPLSLADKIAEARKQFEQQDKTSDAPTKDRDDR